MLFSDMIWEPQRGQAIEDFVTGAVGIGQNRAACID